MSRLPASSYLKKHLIRTLRMGNNTGERVINKTLHLKQDKYPSVELDRIAMPDKCQEL